MVQAFRQQRVIPGFSLTLAFTAAYLSLIIMIPLSATFLKSLAMSWDQLLGDGSVRSPAAFLSAERASVPHSLMAAAIVGITLTAMFGGNGWLGSYLEHLCV
jgi:sulfate transport system permease protein